MIIGITGTLGAGKGATAAYLASAHGFTYLSVRNFIASEVVRRGLMVNRESLIKVGNDLRAEHNPGWLLEQLLTTALAQAKVFRQKDIVIESIRTVGEAQFLKSKDATLWALDADLTIRFNRMVKHAGDKGAPTIEAFKAREAEESTSSNPNEANIPEAMKLADATIVNNGTMEELYAKIEAALAAVQKTA